MAKTIWQRALCGWQEQLPGGFKFMSKFWLMTWWMKWRVMKGLFVHPLFRWLTRGHLMKVWPKYSGGEIWRFSQMTLQCELGSFVVRIALMKSEFIVWYPLVIFLIIFGATKAQGTWILALSRCHVWVTQMAIDRCAMSMPSNQKLYTPYN